MSNVKTYVLLDHLDSKAPIFQHVGNNERVQVKKVPLWSVTLRQTFQDENGIGRTIRYKENAETIDQTEQIEKLKLEANIGWTQNERASRHFRNGVLSTNKASLQKYLEAHPGFIDFGGTCDDFPTRCYKLLDEAKDAEVLNTDIKRQINALNKVIGLDLEQAQALLLKINGTFFTVPTKITECQNILVEYVNDASDAQLDVILEEETSTDDEVNILLGKLMNEGLLSYDAIPNQVSVKRDEEWVKVKEISDEHSAEERNRYFVEFITSPSGKLLLDDLNGLIAKSNKPGRKKKAEG